jgi:6-phosphogluconate dehydrogenase
VTKQIMIGGRDGWRWRHSDALGRIACQKTSCCVWIGARGAGTWRGGAILREAARRHAAG